MKRESGILLHISSLPGGYGIGSMGREAYAFVDFLQKAKQGYWQFLPIGPTGFADSPYQSFSVFAGNPYFIDLDLLVEEGVLLREEIDRFNLPRDDSPVDYGRLFETRMSILRSAFYRGFDPHSQEYQDFLNINGVWIYDYSFFMALKEYFNYAPMGDWTHEIKIRLPDAMHQYGLMLEEKINFHRYIQFLFFRQYIALKRYANARGVKLFGDIPIYPAPDSADVWSQPKNYQIDENYALRAVAGVPPDYFSENGQLWGNPLYNWEQHRADGYDWWMHRFAHLNGLLDALRIDHFRAFHTYFSIPYGDTTAKNGHWEIGPEIDFINGAKERFPGLAFVAEDLGELDEDALQFVRLTGLPGMRVLQFAFDQPESSYLPHRHDKNCVVYTGTHDNDTLMGWLASGKKAAERARAYFDLDGRADNWRVIRTGMASVGDLFIAPIQDYLGQGSAHRMNIPSSPSGNWVYRVKKEQLSAALAAQIADVTLTYGRADPGDISPLEESAEEPETPQGSGAPHRYLPDGGANNLIHRLEHFDLTYEQYREKQNGRDGKNPN